MSGFRAASYDQLCQIAWCARSPCVKEHHLDWLLLWTDGEGVDADYVLDWLLKIQQGLIP